MELSKHNSILSAPRANENCLELNEKMKEKKAIVPRRNEGAERITGFGRLRRKRRRREAEVRPRKGVKHRPKAATPDVKPILAAFFLLALMLGLSPNGTSPFRFRSTCGRKRELGCVSPAEEFPVGSCIYEWDQGSEQPTRVREARSVACYTPPFRGRQWYEGPEKETARSEGKNKKR